MNHLFDCFLELRPLSSPTSSPPSTAQSDHSAAAFHSQNGVQSNGSPSVLLSSTSPPLYPLLPTSSASSSSPPQAQSTSGPEVSAVIVKKYPASYCEEEFLRSVGHFCFPCPQLQHDTITHFSFVLTSVESSWTFGFCRHLPPPDRTCLLLLSSLPWHDTFFKLLNHLAALTHSHDVSKLFFFINQPMVDGKLTLTNCAFNSLDRSSDSSTAAISAHSLLFARPPTGTGVASTVQFGHPTVRISPEMYRVTQNALHTGRRKCRTFRPTLTDFPSEI